MKTKFVLASLAMLAASGMVSANDIAVDAGMLPVSPAAPYGHLFAHDVGAFTDTIDFTVSTSSMSGVGNSLNVALGTVDVLHISDLSYAVWGGTSSASTVWYGTFPGNNISYDIGLSLPGAYHLLVTGTADGTSGGAYGVALISAVPEPEALAMLLAGLGILGVVVRHKKTARKAA